MLPPSFARLASEVFLSLFFYDLFFTIGHYICHKVREHLTSSGLCSIPRHSLGVLLSSSGAVQCSTGHEALEAPEVAQTYPEHKVAAKSMRTVSTSTHSLNRKHSTRQQAEPRQHPPMHSTHPRAPTRTVASVRSDVSIPIFGRGLGGSPFAVLSGSISIQRCLGNHFTPE